MFGFLFPFLGNSANSLNLQIYLLEGLLRWNQDRAAAAVAGGSSTLRTYTGELVYSVNENYNKLYGRKLIPSFTPPAVYTGKYILMNAVHNVFGKITRLLDKNKVSFDKSEKKNSTSIFGHWILYPRCQGRK